MNSKCHPDPFTELHFSYRSSLLVPQVTLIKISADKDDAAVLKWNITKPEVANQDAVVACLFVLEIKTRSSIVHFSTF